MKLINQEMFKTLHDYSSYEPIETVVNDGFTSLYDDSLIRAQAADVRRARKLIAESKARAEESLDYTEVFVRSQYGKSEAQGYLVRGVEECAQIDFLCDKWKAAEDSMKNLTSKIKPISNGFEVRHKFRYKNRVGISELGDYLYIVDKKISRIIRSYDMNDNEEKDLRKRIDLSTTGSEELKKLKKASTDMETCITQTPNASISLGKVMEYLKRVIDLSPSDEEK